MERAAVSNLAAPVKAGLFKSVKIIILLLKIIIPVSCVVVTMKYFNILEPVAMFFSPLMSLVGLPGEAAVVLAFGFFSSVFAAIGAMATIPLTSMEITILAVMIGISHELFVESAICSHTGLKIPVAIALRIGTAMAAGMALNVIFKVIGGV